MTFAGHHFHIMVTLHYFYRKPPFYNYYSNLTNFCHVFYTSKLSEKNKVQFKQILIESENVTMTDAQRILKEKFGIVFSLPHVCNIVRQLGFNYGKPRPKFREAPENGEEILKKH